MKEAQERLTFLKHARDSFQSCFVLVFFFFLIYLFWLCWVIVAVLGLSLVVVSGGFSCCGAWALGGWASLVVARGLSNCGTWASLLRSVWDLPGPGSNLCPLHWQADS